MFKTIISAIALATMLTTSTAKADLFWYQITQYYVGPGQTCVQWNPKPDDPGTKVPDATSGSGCVSDNNSDRQELTTLLREAFIAGTSRALSAAWRGYQQSSQGPLGPLLT
jgi:hypothetical protein